MFSLLLLLFRILSSFKKKKISRVFFFFLYVRGLGSKRAVSGFPRQPASEQYRSCHQTQSVAELSSPCSLAATQLQRQPCHAERKGGGGGQRMKSNIYCMTHVFTRHQPTWTTYSATSVRTRKFHHHQCRHGRTRQHSSRCCRHGDDGEKATHSKLKRKIMNSQGSPLRNDVR